MNISQNFEQCSFQLIKTCSFFAWFQCKYCPKAFVNRQILICHERTHTKEKPFKCSHCDKCFAQASDRISHERIHTGEKPYSCRFCDKKFRKNGALKTHEKTHTGERTVKCSRCSWIFPDTEQVINVFIKDKFSTKLSLQVLGNGFSSGFYKVLKSLKFENWL